MRDSARRGLRRVSSDRVNACTRARAHTYVRSRFACVYGGGARVQRVALCHNVARVRAVGSGSMTLACTRTVSTTLEFRYTRTPLEKKEIRTLYIV